MDWWGDFIAGRTAVEVLRQDGGWLVPIALFVLAALSGLLRWLWKGRQPLIRRRFRATVLGIRGIVAAAGRWVQRFSRRWVPVSRRRYSVLQKQKTATERNWQRDVAELAKVRTAFRTQSNVADHLSRRIEMLENAIEAFERDVADGERAAKVLRKEAPLVAQLFDERGRYVGQPDPEKTWRAELADGMLVLRNLTDHKMTDLDITVMTVDGERDSRLSGLSVEGRGRLPIRPLGTRAHPMKVYLVWVDPLQRAHHTALDVMPSRADRAPR